MNMPVGQWPNIARNWLQIGAPLRPSVEDIGFFGAALASYCDAYPGVAPQGLILGVTPELYALPWPDRNLLRAVDCTQAMIDFVWPGSAAQVLQADWRAIDLPDGSVDIVMCDGGLHLLPYMAGQRALATSLARLVCTGGQVVFRLFLPGGQTETVDQVLMALLAGQIPNLNHLKLRLGAAMMPNSAMGVGLDDVWQALVTATGGNWYELADRLGWSVDHLAVIDAYRGSKARYHFVSLVDVVQLFTSVEDGAFTVSSVHVPAYELGERCPTITFRRT